VCLDSDDDSDSHGDDAANAVPIGLDAHGKAKFRIAVAQTDSAGLGLERETLKVAIKVSVHDESAAKWNLFPVVSLPITLVTAESECLPGDPGVLGVHCCRPVRMPGLTQDILLAESPGSLGTQGIPSELIPGLTAHFLSVWLGIGGKLWDSCLILTRYLSRHRELLQDKSVVELGSGLGLVGIYCSLLDARVSLTDMEVGPALSLSLER